MIFRMNVIAVSLIILFVTGALFVIGAEACPLGCVEATSCPEGCTDAPTPIVEILPNVFFEGEEGNDYANFHFRTKQLGYDLLQDIYVHFYEVEGLSYVSPKPYTVGVGKCTIYTWEEVIESAKKVLAAAIANLTRDVEKAFESNPKTGL